MHTLDAGIEGAKQRIFLLKDNFIRKEQVTLVNSLNFLNNTFQLHYMESNGKMIVNDKLIRMWAWLVLIYYPCICLTRLRKTMKNVSG
jgi:hypothetical protein